MDGFIDFELSGRIICALDDYERTTSFIKIDEALEEFDMDNPLPWDELTYLAQIRLNGFFREMAFENVMQQMKNM